MTEHLPVALGRALKIQRLQAEVFDLLVIGGGINGAGIARDAAMRGLRVALVEKGDFASGTSSKSSKLIHGGIRYLQMGDFHLVRASCRERDLLRRRLAPHLVQPLAFLFPVYKGDPVGVLALRLGMWLYDLLATFRNIRRHRMLTPRRTLAIEPGLRLQGLHGTALYYDCFTDDARLTLETVLAAEDEGAVAVNYVQLDELIKEEGRIVGARINDRFGNAQYVVRAQRVVNATGPWVDQIRRLDDPEARPCLRLTKGVHAVVPRARVGNVHAVVMHSRRDQRVMFAIPWGAHTIIGTTDTDFVGTPDEAAADEADIAYLLETINWFFPAARLSPADVVSTYAGLRPLVASADATSPSDVSREEEIFESPSGLITIAGGKLTTYRVVAEEVVNRVLKRSSKGAIRRGESSKTAEKPLPGGRISPHERVVRELVAGNGNGLNREQIDHLAWRYGSRATEVTALAHDDTELRRMLVPGMPDIWAEVEFAARHEMALEPEDILLRRTSVGLKAPTEGSQLTEKLHQKLATSRD